MSSEETATTKPRKLQGYDHETLSAQGGYGEICKFVPTDGPADFYPADDVELFVAEKEAELERLKFALRHISRKAVVIALEEGKAFMGGISDGHKISDSTAKRLLLELAPALEDSPDTEGLECAKCFKPIEPGPYSQVCLRHSTFPFHIDCGPSEMATQLILLQAEAGVDS